MPEIKNITFSFTEYNAVSDLVTEDQELIEAALNACRNAYAPYSKFMVGASLRLASGRIITGSNVENAAFPSGICAERTALAWAVSNYPDDHITTIAITAINNDRLVAGSISPCGNCRQVIAEEEMRTGKKIRLILSGKNKIQVIESAGLLLPLQFCRNNIMPDHP
jgi:cytidine deaminase